MSKSTLKIFNELIESLKQAEGAASQLVHNSGHPKAFIFVRNTLGTLREACTIIAPHNAFIQPKTVFTKKA